MKLIRIPFLSLIVIWGCSQVQLSTQSDKARQYYLEGLKLEKKNPDAIHAALENYKNAIREDAAFYEAYVTIASLYEKQGSYRKAALYFEKALALRREPGRSALPYARTLYNLNRYEESYELAKYYNENYPSDAQGLSFLADAARAMNKPGIESDLLRLTKMDSANAYAWSSLAQYYYDQGDFAMAIPIYDRMLREKLHVTTDMRYEYALCQLHVGLWSDALPNLEQVLREGINDKYPPHLAQAVRLIISGTFKEEALNLFLKAMIAFESVQNGHMDRQEGYGLAKQSLTKSLEIEPDFFLSRHLAARLLYVMEEYDEAFTNYEWLTKNNMADSDDFANMGFLLFKKNQLKEAQAYYEKSLSIKSDQPSVKSSLETIRRINEGKISQQAYFYFEKALAHTSGFDSTSYYLRLAIAADSLYPEAYLQLGLIQYRNGQYKAAEPTLLRGLQLAYTDKLKKNFHYNLALVYSRLDWHDKSIQQFLQCLRIDTADGDALYYLSKVYADKSDYENAVSIYETLSRRVPEYFVPDENDLQQAGIGQFSQSIGPSRFYFDDSLRIGQTNTYRLKIKSKNDALLGADANGDLSREIIITFQEQVLDITPYGVAEFALDILEINGYAIAAKEKAIQGQRFYLRISDIYGVTNIYGLMEEDPVGLSRLVIAVMEDLHGNFTRRVISEGEIWRSGQNIFKLGNLDAVTELDDINSQIAYGKKYYGVLGSYDAARYGETGYVTIQNKGESEFEFDIQKRLIRKLKNVFVTKEFRDATAKLTQQDASYSVDLIHTTIEKLEKPKKVVLENIPYVRQHGPQCAAASLSMVLSYYKQSIDQDEIYEKIKSDYAGAQSNDIIHYPRSLGKYKSFGYVGTLDDLKRRIDQGIPVLVFLSPFGFGHVVVVIGYDETKHQIIMHDPTVANNHAIPYDDFLREWQQSGNECAIVLPLETPVVVTEEPLNSYQAVEKKWEGDKASGVRNFDKAIQLYRESLRLKPNYEGAMEGMMLLHLQKDEFDKASVIMDTLLQMRPNSIDLILRRAGLLLSQYDYDKVLQITRRAKQIDESNITNYLYSASALFSQKKYDEAMNELKQAIRINPLISQPRTFYASILAETGDFEKAHEQLNFALRYEPENIGNYLSVAGLYQTEINVNFLTAQEKADRIKKAIDALDVVKQANSSLPNLDQIYADIYTAADDFKRGDSLMFENIRKYPEENGAYNNIAWRYAVSGIKLDAAEKYSQKSIELSQRNPYYFDTMGWIHLKMAVQVRKIYPDSAESLMKKAESEFLATIEYDMYSDFAYRHLGVLYAVWGKLTQATAEFEKVAAMMPDKARIYAEIGQDCEELGLYEISMNYYRKAIDIRPNFAYAKYRMAYILAIKMNDYTKAESYILEALQVDSVNFLYTGMQGIIAFLKQDNHAAIRILDKVCFIQSTFTDEEAAINNYYFGMALLKTNQITQAKTQFMEYLRRSPDGEYSEIVKKRIK